MRLWPAVIVLALSATIVAGAQERPVPKDSSRVSITGCARDRTFVVLSPASRESPTTSIQAGRRFRLNGPREVLNDIKARQATMVEITGLVKKSDVEPGGISMLGGRVRIGGAMPRDPIRDPIYDQVVIDVESFMPLPDRCPAR